MFSVCFQCVFSVFSVKMFCFARSAKKMFLVYVSFSVFGFLVFQFYVFSVFRFFGFSVFLFFGNDVMGPDPVQRCDGTSPCATGWSTGEPGGWSKNL